MTPLQTPQAAQPAMTLARASIGNRVSCSSGHDARNSLTPALPAPPRPELGPMRPQGVIDRVSGVSAHRACDAASNDPESADLIEQGAAYGRRPLRDRLGVKTHRCCD